MADSFPGSSDPGGESFPQGDGLSGESCLPADEVMLFRRYRVQRELGRGGMGVVVLAHDTALDIPVAVKLVPDLVVKDEEAIADLRKEVLRGMALMHPGIVRTHNFERDESGAGIVMEFVDGDTLSGLKVRQPGGCFQPEQILPWIEQLCAVLDYAHREARIVHRDLKPRNVMIARAGKLKVADFGIAATLSDSVSRHSMEGMISGTLSYMSPQQAQGQRPTHLDDIHALGATIYELLTGKPPFFRGNPTAIHAQILTAVPPSMAERRQELEISGRAAIPAAWERAVAACLAKEPAQRPQSAGEVLARLSGVASASSAGTAATKWIWIGVGALGVGVLGTLGYVATREKPAPAPVVAKVEATPLPATPEPATPAPATPVPATPTPAPTPVATPTPAPVAAVSPAKPKPKAKPKPAPAVVATAPMPTATPPPFSGAYIVLPTNTPAPQTPPPGVPVFHPNIDDFEFRRLYPRNPRAFGPDRVDGRQPSSFEPPQPTPARGIGVTEADVAMARMQAAERERAYALQNMPPPVLMMTPPPMPVPTPVPATAPLSERLSSYVADLDGWLTTIEVEPNQMPRQQLRQLREEFRTESTKAAVSRKAAYEAAIKLCDLLLGALDAREAALRRMADSQAKPGVRLGSGTNRAFFEGQIRADWQKQRAGWRRSIDQAQANLRQLEPPAPAN